MREWQWERICRLVRHAYETVPFYTEHYRSATRNTMGKQRRAS